MIKKSVRLETDAIGTRKTRISVHGVFINISQDHGGGGVYNIWTNGHNKVQIVTGE